MTPNDKIKATLKAEYTKANSTRKTALATKYGFADNASFEKYLGIVKAVPKKKIATKKPARTNKVKEEKSIQLTDIVVAFDTTGSMSSYIEDVKKYVKDFIPEMFSKTENLQLGIVAFGDYCDMKNSKEFGNAYQVTPLTDDANKLIKFISTAKNTGGGDGDEFYELVIKKIVEETAWREGSNKSILLIGDCGPHAMGYSCYSFVENAQIDWKKECQKAKDLGIKIDTLSIRGLSFYEKVAEITGGICLPFKKSENTTSMLKGYTAKRSGSLVYFADSKLEANAKGDVELTALYKTLDSIK